MSLLDSISKLKQQFTAETESIQSGQLDPDALKIKYLSRKGLVASLFAEMRSVSKEERPVVGKELNQLKLFVGKRIEDLFASSAKSKETTEIKTDFTLPGDPFPVGSIHPITQVMNDIISDFVRLGFSSAYGPEVDTDFYNFGALNFPPNHPARDMQDTFFIDKDVMLRSHTSNSQIHFMETHEPPVKIAAPGRVYRHEDISVRSYCVFHQVEGLFVDKNVTMADLKGDLDYFARTFFGEGVKTRFRPSYFPFTEPSAEMDISCIFCGGDGCAICKHTGWLEILGCGMVDPEVFKAVGYDPDVWQGYAFGMGIERTAMLKYGIEDIRLFYQGDIRFLRQF